MITFFIILLTFIFSAFFSGMEIAFVSANKLRIEIDRKQGIFPSRIISIFTDNPSQYIATMLVGNTISLVTYGSMMAIILKPVIHSVVESEAGVLIIQTIVATLLILIPAEFLPKAFFRKNANFILAALAVPVMLFYILLYPVARFSIWLSELILGHVLHVGTGQTGTKVVFGKIDLDHFVNQEQPETENNQDIEHKIRIFRNALDFSEVKIRECMVPRTEIIAIEVNESIEELKSKFIKTGYSRILVFQDQIDNIIGYVKSSKLFTNPASIKEMMMPAEVVPESMSASRLLENFMKNSSNIAVVVDEFGGTAGIVTSEDIIEEIFGEIMDEHDKSELVEQQISDNEYTFSGRLEIDYLNEKYDLGIQESDEYNTIAGYILLHHSSMPVQNEIFNVPGFRVTILKGSSTRIQLVSLKRVQS